MLHISFYLLKERKKLVTGGHKYDRMLFDTIKENPKININEVVIGKKSDTPKILAPLVELINGIKNLNTDICLFNSSCCLRLLLFILYIRCFTKKPCYTIHHHFLYLEFKGLKRLIYKTAETIFLKCSSKIIVPSPYIYDRLKRIKKEKDLLLWRIPFETKQEFPARPIPGNLTFAGTIEKRKGLIYLFEALNILQTKGIHYRLDILGKVVEQAYYERLVEYARTLNLNVNFLGFVELEEKNKILSETDIFVFPSLLEGFGMVLVEAQVYGLPIVCFNNSAMPFSVKNGINGFVVQDFDYNSMAEKIGEVIENRELRRSLSEGAFKNLKSQWTYKRFKETVSNYFSKLIDQEV